jgi:hypothetical protein
MAGGSRAAAEDLLRAPVLDEQLLGHWPRQISSPTDGWRVYN